jgi:hypothetical protein
MLDLLFILGQAASVLLLMYGGFLVLVPARKAPADAKLDESVLVSSSGAA